MFSSHSHSSCVDTPSRSACLLHDQAKSTATDYPDTPPPHSFCHTDKLVWEPSVWFARCLCLTVWNEVTLRHDADNRHERWWGASPSGNCAEGIHTRAHNHLLSHTLIAWSLAFSLWFTDSSGLRLAHWFLYINHQRLCSYRGYGDVQN